MVFHTQYEHLGAGEDVRKFVGVLVAGGFVEFACLLRLLPALIDRAGEIIGLRVLRIELTRLGQLAFSHLKLALLDRQLRRQDMKRRIFW